jgi:hypothetical protein
VASDAGTPRLTRNGTVGVLLGCCAIPIFSNNWNCPASKTLKRTHRCTKLLWIGLKGQPRSSAQGASSALRGAYGPGSRRARTRILVGWTIRCGGTTKSPAGESRQSAFRTSAFFVRRGPSRVRRRGSPQSGVLGQGVPATRAKPPRQPLPRGTACRPPTSPSISLRISSAHRWRPHSFRGPPSEHGPLHLQEVLPRWPRRPM